MKGHKGNKILTKEEITNLASESYKELIKGMNKFQREAYLEFHYKMRELESWINTQLKRNENSKLKKGNTSLNTSK